MTRTEKVAAVVCFAACAVVVAASFLPWVSIGGTTLSGWDLVRHQRDVGGNPFVVWNFMTSDNGASVWLAVWAALVVVVGARHEPGRVLTVSATVAALGGAVFGFENVYFYVLGSSGTDVALEGGLVLLWGAVAVACVAFFLVLRQVALPHHGSTPHPAH
jgi:hypothetical protein